MESHGIGLNDGLLARLLKSSEWKVHRISDACLLSHSPSPQLCALNGGVWDDSVFSLMQHSGGRCLEKDEAEDVLLDGGHDLEMVEVSVSHDGSSECITGAQYLFSRGVQIAVILENFAGYFFSLKSISSPCSIWI